MKTKFLIMLVAMFVSTLAMAQERTLKAFYLGYDKESEVYSFEDADGTNIEFTKVESDVLKKFDLRTPELVDEAFLITYTVKEIGDDEEYSEEYRIIFLKQTVLERNQESDDAPEDDED